MKFKKYKQKSDGKTILKVSLDKKDQFNYVMAMHLSDNKFDNLLSFSFNTENPTSDLFYDITGLAPLKTLLETKLSLLQFQSLLKQIAVLLETLNFNAMPEKNIILNTNRIYSQVEDFSLQFIYLPLDSQAVNDRAVLDLLSFLANNARFVVEGDKQYAEALTDFIKRQNIFSLVDLKAFLGLGSIMGRGPGAPQIPIIPLDNNGAQVMEQPKQRTGRDFVTESSGVQTKEQRFESQSFAEYILSEVSGDLDTGPDLQDPRVFDAAPPLPPQAPDTSNPPYQTRAPVYQTQPEAQLQALPQPQLQALPQVQTPEAQPQAQPQALPQAQLQTLSQAQPQAQTPELNLISTREHYVLIRVQDGKSWTLGSSSLTLGRSRNAQLQVSESIIVSRVHATLYIDSNYIALEDLGSSNGTYINSVRLKPHQRALVYPGDTITLGDQVFQLSIVPPA